MNWRLNTLRREGVQISLGFTANLNVELTLATLQETVAVTGESPIIDTSTTRVQQNFKFKLAKDPTQHARLDAIHYNLSEICRVLAILLWPFIPESAERIFAQLGLPDRPDRLANLAWGGLPPGHTIGQPEVLFPRKDADIPRP